MIPINTSLGKLEIFEIYEYIDGPRLFAARNNIGTIYLVYWFDEREDATGWLYLPISETRLDELRRKTITLNTAFNEPETNYYIVYTDIHPGKDTADPIAPHEIDTEFFPPEGYYIEYVDVVNEQRNELLKGSVGGKNVEPLQAGTNLVLLASDVAEAFPTENAVNETLRLVMRMAQIPVGIQQKTALA